MMLDVTWFITYLQYLFCFYTLSAVCSPLTCVKELLVNEKTYHKTLFVSTITSILFIANVAFKQHKLAQSALEPGTFIFQGSKIHEKLKGVFRCVLLIIVESKEKHGFIWQNDNDSSHKS